MDWGNKSKDNKMISDQDKTIIQSVFDKVASALIEQQEPAFDGVSCHYRLTKDNVVLKCAIGHLISDEQINKFKVHADAGLLGFNDELIKELIPSEDTTYSIFFLHNLQVMHDDSAKFSVLRKEPFINVFKEYATNFAKQQELNVNF